MRHAGSFYTARFQIRLVSLQAFFFGGDSFILSYDTVSPVSIISKISKAPLSKRRDIHISINCQTSPL